MRSPRNPVRFTEHARPFGETQGRLLAAPVIGMARKTNTSRPVVTPLLLRVVDVSVLLGISEREVWGMLRRGELVRVVIPGRRMTRIAREDVERLVQRWRQNAS